MSVNTEIAGAFVWSAPSTVKIAQDDISYANKRKAELYFNAVKNEYESQQLFLTAFKRVNDYDLEINDLRCGENIFGKENITVYHEKFMDIEQDKNYEAVKVADALIPLYAAKAHGELNIQQDRNAGLWITIYVPKETTAGVYKGTFCLSVDGESIDIPVTVKVNDYTLTDEVNAKTLFSWRYDRVGAGELDSTIEMMETYYKFFLDFRISLQSMPLESLTGEEMVSCLERYYDKLSTFCFLSEVGEISNNLFSAKEALREQVLAVAAASKPERNYFEKAMLYVIDEPDLQNEVMTRSKLLDFYQMILDYMKEFADEIEHDTTGKYECFKQIEGWKKYVTDVPSVVPCSSDYPLKNADTQRAKDFFNLVNCICPHWFHLETDQVEHIMSLVKKYNLKLWWYGSMWPIAPGANYHLSNMNILSARTISWLQKKFHVIGNLYWDAVAYTSEDKDQYNQFLDVYTNQRRMKVVSAGDGNLCYPGAPYGIYGPLPSIRLMSIRDGMEEYEILADVEKHFGDMEKFYAPLYDGNVSMYADGENGLDFDNLRKALIDTAVSMKKNEIQLLSFDSYKEITGTRIRLENEFGKISINKDARYIKEGTASMKVEPQGDYNRPDWHPYMQFDCTESTIATCDFSNFEQIAFDVYNNMDKDLHIIVSLWAKNAYGEATTVPMKEYTLAANAWTTCEYDLSGEQFEVGYYDLTEVRYIKITFLEHKTSKEDTLNELYFDNLKGYYKEKTRKIETYVPDLSQGVGFEQANEQKLVFAQAEDDFLDLPRQLMHFPWKEIGAHVGKNYVNLSRVSYEAEGMEVPEELGKYGLKGVVSGSKWPTFTVHYGEEVAKDAVLSFQVYVKTESESYTIQSEGNCIMAACPCGEWFEAKIQLIEAQEVTEFFFELESDATIYLDHFRISGK